MWDFCPERAGSREFLCMMAVVRRALENVPPTAAIASATSEAVFYGSKPIEVPVDELPPFHRAIYDRIVENGFAAGLLGPERR